ncbi:MAG: pyridoxamine 5'-phosphate oxidase family protein [Acidobacteria bacterium]|nr:pyridoxamine 5'-phosphate oxidase family protein [Acidobacteriota bacterium]
MAKMFDRIDERLAEFARGQKIFFTASAAADGRVNVSPKDGASLRVLDERKVAYLDQTGSGNETAAHVRASGRLTLMFCAFEGAPMILRFYGTAKVLPRRSAEYLELLDSAFGGVEPPGARQIVVLSVDRVQTSCGYGVPLFDYVGERETLKRWAMSKGEAGLKEYRQQKNAQSIDGLPTGLVEFEDGPAEVESGTRMEV